MSGRLIPWLRAALPFLGWWPRVDRAALRGDLLAGLTGALIVLPQGVAFATIAGLPPEYGLYTAMVPAVVAALFGSSWHLVSGPTTAISIVVFAAISPLAEPGSAQYVSLALTLAFLVGAMQLAMGLGRLGTLVNFISHTVVIGFTAGAAILIAASQLKNFFGIAIPRGASFAQILRAMVAQAGEASPYVTAVGAVTLLTGLLVRRYARRFPYMIAAMLVGSLAGVLLDRIFGPAVTGIRTVGALPRSLPPLSHPVLSAEVVKQLGGNAFAITMLALTEAVSIARAIAVRSEQRIDGNQEFIGQGLSNIVGSFFSSYASSGSFNRSGLNYEAGARTPLAAVFAAFFLAAVLVLVAPLAAYLPVAAMAGILFLVAWGLIDFHHIRAIVRASRSETAILLVTFLSTLFLDLEYAIYAGVILSLGFYLSRTSRPLVASLAPDQDDARRGLASEAGQPECSQLKIVEVHGSLFFGAVSHVQQVLHAVDPEHPQQKHVLVVAHSVNFTDVAGAEMLVQEARRRRRMGGGLYLAGVKPRTLEVLRRGGYLEEIGEGNVFRDLDEAIEKIDARLDKSACRACRKPVFERCRALAPAAEVRRPLRPGLAAAMAAAAFAEEGEMESAREIMGEASAGGPAGQPEEKPDGLPVKPALPALTASGGG
ncbi:MAG TPA: SulP family inorganic anion transporter [Anaeromyxobacteraceae bacterium]|nr:SulP family inorganic anion transporter [Anaeromyxobacteraceae bacterium]